MIRKRLPLLLVASLILSVATIQAQAKAHRVLFALSSADEIDWKITLSNVRNLVNGMAPDPVEIEVVAFGPGIAFLKNDASEASEIRELESKHIRFVACGNAVQKQHLLLSNLVPGAEVVPAGIVEVVRKQEQGWTYIKAGR